MNRLAFAAFVAALGLAASTARGADPLAEAKANFEKVGIRCDNCHGKDGKGETKLGQKMGVRDYTDPKVQEKLKDEEMFKAIKEGVKKASGTAMKPYGDKLSDAEIKGLVAYIRSFKKK